MARHGIVQILFAAGAGFAGTSFAAPSLGAQCVPAVQRLVTERNYNAASADLQAQLKRAPNDAAAMQCLGRVLIDQGETGGAVEWLEKAVTIDARNAQSHLLLGLALRAEGSKASMLSAPGLVGRMKTHLEQAVALDPKLIDARYALLQFHVQAPAMMGGSLDKAREQAAELLKLSPMRGHIGTAVIAEQEKDLAAAEKEFLAAIAAKPDSDVTYSVTGAFYRRRERWTDAVAMYEKQLKAMLKDASPGRRSAAHYYLGMSHDKGGHREKARAEYQAAIAADPKNEDAKKALASLKEK